MCYMSYCVSSHSLELFTVLLYDYSVTSDLENLFSSAHSHDEHLCQVSFNSLHSVLASCLIYARTLLEYVNFIV